MEHRLEQIRFETSLPKIYAITLNWNGKTFLAECLKSLQQMDYPNFEIIVVDNGSTDGSIELIKNEFPRVTLIENGENLGYAKGFNVGLEHAYRQGADYFLILNNDTVIDRMALPFLVDVAETDPMIGFVSGKVYHYNEPKRIQTVGKKKDAVTLVGEHVGAGEIDEGQFDKQRDYDFVDDVFLLVRRKVYEEAGGYDPHFFLYCEESDWCVRVRKAGFLIVYTPKAKIWHKGSMSSGGGMNPTHIYYLTRNTLVFLRKNGTSYQLALFILLSIIRSPRQSLHYIKRGKYKHFQAYIHGFLSGFFEILRVDRQ